MTSSQRLLGVCEGKAQIAWIELSALDCRTGAGALLPTVTARWWCAPRYPPDCAPASVYWDPAKPHAEQDVLFAVSAWPVCLTAVQVLPVRQQIVTGHIVAAAVSGCHVCLGRMPG